MTLDLALQIVTGLIAIVTFISGGVSMWLIVRYIRYNHIKNSAGLTGTAVARAILDQNELEHIKVKETGSILFGNSYSHYFKKVRLRRFTRNKDSLTAIGMGAQKAALAILDKEGDSDMKRRIRLYPLITFGPFAFIPLITIGALLDYFFLGQTGTTTLIMLSVGLLFYIYAIFLAILTLRTERKAQDLAYDILQSSGYVTDEELEHLKNLFKLYNIQYVNDIILSSLELVRFALEIFMFINKNKD